MIVLGCCSYCCPHSTTMTILYLNPMRSQNRIQRESESCVSLSGTSDDHQQHIVPCPVPVAAGG